MSYTQLLVDSCDIYHLISTAQGGKFGVPSPPLQEYGGTPDLPSTRCYFAPTNGLNTVVEQKPGQMIIESFLVHFLPSIDVRLNDKVVWNGTEYFAQNPRKVRGHHIEVVVARDKVFV